VTTDVLTALISASAAMITAIVALALNHRAFTMLDNRIGDTNRRIDDTHRRFDDINHRIDDINRRIDDIKAELLRHLSTIESYLKQFFQVQAEHAKRIQRLEDKP